jgi:glutamyl-tRNA reductase
VSILLIGLNYRTAPVEVREKLAFSREGAAGALLLFRRKFPDAEVAILSTCNRVELLVSGDEETVTQERVVAFLSHARDVAVEAFGPYLYYRKDGQAVRHFFRVIGGLDSMVVGESQIVSQIKQAYELATTHETAGAVLHRLFHHAFGVSKRVRSETTIADGKTSMPSVAVDCVRETLPDFASRRILIVGAGEMARLTAEYLREANATDFVVTTRTLINAKALAEICHGTAVPFSELDEQIACADVVITATNSPVALLTRQRVRAARKACDPKPLALVDLSVPRNIDPDVRDLPGVQLYDVDALGKILEDNQRQRLAQLESCEQIVEEEVAAFEKWAAESKVRPLIEQMYQDVRALAEIEVRSFMHRCPDLTESQKEAVSQLADRLVGKLMHPCVCAVRQQNRFDGSVLAEAFHGVRIGFASHTAGAA